MVKKSTYDELEQRVLELEESEYMRKNAEEKLRESEERFRQLFENMMNGFALHEIICDHEGQPVNYRFLAVNPSFERLTGLNKETLLGRTVLDVLPDTEKFWIEKFGQVAITGEPVEFEDFSQELNRHFLVTAYRPASRQFACVLQDITERKKIEDSLAASEERYRQLFNSIRDFILVADTDRNIIDCNHALLDGFGYKQEEIFGKKTIYLYASKKEYQEMGNELKKHIDNALFTYTINYKKKSGDVFPGETHVFYLKNDKEDIVGFIGVIRDITYRNMVEESLRIANDELGQKTAALEDMNTALKILLQKRELDNQELEENIFSNYELLLRPFLNKLKSSASTYNQKNLVEIVDTNLNEMVAPFSKKLSDPLMSLTSSEIQIASMIKQGLSNKEIAQILNCSKRTVDTHRDNIRKKLNLRNKKINLKTYLSNL